MLKSLFTYLTQMQRRMRGWRTVPDSFWLDKLIQHGAWPGDFSLDSKNRLIIPHADSHVPKMFAENVVPVISILRSLAARGAALDFDKETGPTVTAHGIAMRIEGHSEASIFDEIVMRQFYRMTLHEPTIVIDIGMNVGLASLYFASHPQVIAVYGFEPFEPTYRSALENFQINPEIASKIIPENMGVAAKTYTTEAMYHAALNGALGVNGIAAETGDRELQSVSIHLKSAADVLNDIRAKHPDCHIVIKMDCEGSEREIIPALCALPKINKNVAMNIETHFGCEDEIIKALEDAEFCVFALETEYLGVWLVHALSGCSIEDSGKL